MTATGSRLPDRVDRCAGLLRAAASGVVVVGVLLLIRLLVRAVAGPPGDELSDRHLSGSWLTTLSALALALPVPLHVIAVGLIVQKRWLSPLWARVAWYAVVISGCWLGVALAVKLLVL